MGNGAHVSARLVDEDTLEVDGVRFVRRGARVAGGGPLPCPFCGGRASVDGPDEGEFYLSVLHEPGCFLREWTDGDFPERDGALDAHNVERLVEAWNRRARR